MFKPAVTASCASRGRSEPATCGSSRRRLRNRLTPGAESLEVRDCPSAMVPQLGVAGPAHGPVDTDHAVPLVRHGDSSPHDGTDAAVPLKRAAKTKVQTIYVATTGKLGASAGKSAAHPLGSLTVAFKRLKSGDTIVLAAGTYTQNVGLTGKSGITIDGAGEGVTKLVASGAQTLKVYSSSSITIENLSISSTGGIGLAVAGSSVNLNDVQADGSNGDNVVVTAYGGQPGVLNASHSNFDNSQTGDGLHLESGGSATISNSTFNGNGTSPSVTLISNGLVVDAGATSLNVTDSQFNGNTNEGLDASGTGQVTVSGSTFENNIKGNGALIFDQVSINLTGNTFALNGQVVGITQGYDGIEFYGIAGQPHHYTGTAVVSDNSFLNNTAVGIFVSSAGQITISDNQFQGNIVGLFLDGTNATVNASVVGNTIGTVPNPPSGYQGVVAQGTGLTATIGGTGSNANTFENYPDNASIYEATGGGIYSGPPNLTILTNIYLQNGQPVDPSVANTIV